jgi:hypothetical protein
MEEKGSNLWKGFRGGKKGRRNREKWKKTGAIFERGFGEERRGGGIGRKWKKMGAIFERGFGSGRTERGEMSIVNSDIDDGEIEIKEEELKFSLQLDRGANIHCKDENASNCSGSADGFTL